MKSAIVKSRKRSSDGTLIRETKSNPTFDTRIYEVDFENGSYYDYSANVILENLYEQVDDYGQSTSTLANIIDHTKDGSAIPKEKG